MSDMTSAQVRALLKDARIDLEGEVVHISAVIASGASLSGAIDLGGARIMAIIMPSAWTTAANITFAASSAIDGTFVKVQDDQGNETTLAGVAASVAIGLDSQGDDLKGFRFLKIRSGTAASAVNQAAARTLIVVAKK